MEGATSTFQGGGSVRSRGAARVPRRSRLRHRGSQTCSSSDDDFHSDDNLRPYEEVKIAHHDKKLAGLGLTPNEQAVSPLLPAAGPGARAYSYLSGSDEETEGGGRVAPRGRGVPPTAPPCPPSLHYAHTTLTADLHNGDVRHKPQQTSESDDDNQHLSHRVSRTGTLPLPPPSLPPPPPPPPIEDIPQRSPAPLRHKTSGLGARAGNYADIDGCVRHGHQGVFSESDGELVESPYLVQGSCGIPVELQHRFPRTVPRSGSAPSSRGFEVQNMQGEAYPQLYPSNDQPLILPGTPNRQTLSGYPQFGVASVPMGQYPPSQDYYAKFSTASHRMKKQLKQQCTWKCTALILLILCVALLACTVYFAATSMFEEQQQVARNGSSRPQAKRIRLGESMDGDIPGKAFLLSHFYQSADGFVTLNFTMSEHAIVGVYGRRNREPTHLQYDFFKAFQARSIQGRTRRYLQSETKDTATVQYLQKGTWFLGIYNDNDRPEPIHFTADVSGDMEHGCSGDCHGQGKCLAGQCHCFPGFSGDQCQHATCQVLCSGNGDYVSGECHCFAGWKGRECEFHENECEVPDCNNNGHCINGQCVCFQGYQGPACSIVDCLLPNCSGNGLCVLGQCMCYKGYRGTNCSIPDKINITQICARDCSGHGLYDVEADGCKCEEHFTGANCETEICRLECQHGHCKNQRCVCDQGWSGALCDQVQCDHRCQAHGYCNNGTCVCWEGWNGKHCTIDGCPKECHGHGSCKRERTTWQCQCQDGWKGAACDIAMETECTDKDDNDQDGLVDCEDPDCCSALDCGDSQYCKASPDPRDILLRKQPPSTTASFYEKMRFLIEENSVQTYATRNSFNESQVSVIRGKVTTKDGTPLIGVRVGVVTQPLYGYTLSRKEGIFDILVNGGGSVKLEFIRAPFRHTTASVLVPWNQIITTEDVVMALDGETIIPTDPRRCSVEHQHYSLRPVVLSTWQHTQLGACPDKSTIIPESQVLQESLEIPGTMVHLVYHSSESPGYMSLIMIQMTPASIPAQLSLIHLKVSVEGVVVEEVFEADPNLKYTFSWDRRNAFNQKVYGIVTARVYVGYQYDKCDHIFWETRSTTVNGFDLTSSEIGGWNLDIHHTYNFQEGILHKGDGTNIYLKEKPKKIVNILGSGHRRKLECEGCNGKALENRLLAPVALASGLDGSLYVGDYNFIRKLSPDREEIASILEMSTKSIPYKFYMTVSPVDGRLYISDFMSHRVIRVKTMGPVRDLQDNYEHVAGNGEECTPGEADLCGDGGKAIQARLRHPKGIAISKDGLIYIADGPNIRRITSDGIIDTLIGTQEQLRQWTPMPCDDILAAEKISLKWPTALAIDPLDDTLHILDQNIVLKLTKDYKLVAVAGRPAYCPPRLTSFLPTGVLSDDDQASSVADQVTLVSPESITFGPHGDFYIVESDVHHINRVRVVTTDGLIHHFAGAKSKCDCQKSICQCYNPKEVLAAQALFSTPTSITVTPDGVMHLADMGNLRVFSIVSELPKPNAQRQYEVVSPETEEIYVFNHFGQHRHTTSIMTGQYMYNFTYHVNSYYGKLTSVVDAAGNTVTVKRHYDTQTKEIVTPSGQACQLIMDNMRRLYQFKAPNNETATFTYTPSSGLLESKHTSDGKTYTYKYDDMGRLLKISLPTGEITQLQTDVNTTGSIVHVTTDSSDVVAMATYGSVQSVMHDGDKPVATSACRGSTQTRVTYLPDGAVVVQFPSNLTVAMETGGHPIMENEHRMHYKRKVLVPDAYIHRLEWRFYLRRKGRTRQSRIIEKLGHRLRVGVPFSRHANTHDSHEDGFKEKALLINGENLLTIEYDMRNHMETVLDKDLRELITVVYDSSGLPTYFLPATGHHAMNISYSQHGQVLQWQYGEMREQRLYNERNLMIERTATNGAQFRYFYRYGAKPTDVILPSGKQYQFHHDDQGHLRSITTPVLGVHRFHTVLSIGIQRLLYQPAGLHLPFLQDFDANGKLLRTIFPSEQRRVFYRYNHHFQVASELFDQTAVNFLYSPESQRVRLAEVVSRGYSCSQLLHYRSSLVSHHSVRFPKDPMLLGANFSLEHDNNFRLVSTTVVFTNNVSLVNNISYSEINGKMRRVKGMLIDWPTNDKEVMRDDHVVILREFDSYGRLKDMQMKFGDSDRFMLQINYDSMNRVHQWRRRVGQTDTQAVEYIYDIDGNVVEVLLEGRSTWRYGYDANSNMNKISEDGKTWDLEFDVGDRITTFAELRYKFDEDGFMAQRGYEHVHFNSRGQLVSVSRKGEFKFAYYYDPQGRLVVQRDQYGRILQFFYADPQQLQRVTHTYNHTTGEVSQYLYDDRGRLLALERRGALYYVATDPIGSPLVVFDADGYVVKQLGFNPLGLLLFDSNPNFELCFGFQGQIFNPVTQLVHYPGRVYDPQIGRWMSPDYDNIFSRLRDVIEEPQILNLYQHRQLVNTHASGRGSPRTDLIDWLNVLGYNIESMAPDVSYTGDLNPSPARLGHQLLPSSSAFECTFRRDMHNLLTISTVPQSRITPRQPLPQERPAPWASIFGRGVTVSVVEGKAVVNIADVASEWARKLATILLNGAEVVDLRFTIHGRDEHFFVKPSYAKADEELRTLGITSSSAVFEKRVNVTVNRNPHSRTFGQPRDEVDVRLHGNHSVINIRYGTTLERERQRVLHHAKERAVRHAWERERYLSQHSLPTHFAWSEEQLKQLETLGHIMEFEGQYIRDSSHYPELADDCNNIRFVRKAR